MKAGTSAPNHARTPLSFAAKLLWGFPGLAGNSTALIASAFLNKYYIDEFGVPLSLLSVAVFVSSAISLYFEVFVGYVGDRLQSVYGRRRPLLCVFGPLKEVCFFLLLFPVPLLAQRHPEQHTVMASAWFCTFYFLYNFFNQSAEATRLALGTELTNDATERASLYSWGNGLMIAGLVLAAVLSAVIGSFYSQRTTFAVLGVVIASIGLASYFLLVRFLRENTDYRRKGLPLLPSLRRCFRNQVWVQYIKSTACLGAMNELTGLYAYAIQYIFHKKPRQVEGAIVGVYAIVQLLVLPLLVWVIRRKGKLFVFRLSWGLVAFHGVCMFFSTFANLTAMTASVAIMAVGIAGLNVTANIMISDVIDYDELLSGKRREATYQAVSDVPTEFFSVGGKALPLIALNVAGYVPGGNADGSQPLAVIWVLRLFMGCFPLLLASAGLYFIRGYPVHEAMHKRIVEVVEEMHRKSNMLADYGPAGYGAVAEDAPAVLRQRKQTKQRSAQHQGGGGVDDGKEHDDSNEAKALCVVDPITTLLVPVPPPNVPEELDSQVVHDDDIEAALISGGTTAARTCCGVQLKLASDDTDHSNKWLLDYFSLDDLKVLQHLGSQALRSRVRWNLLGYSLATVVFIGLGITMLITGATYTAFVFMFGGVFLTVVVLTWYLRVGASEKLLRLPQPVLVDSVRQHRVEINRFRAHQLMQATPTPRPADSKASGDNAATDPAQELTELEDAEFLAGVGCLRRHMSATILLLFVIAGALILVFGVKESADN